MGTRSPNVDKFKHTRIDVGGYSPAAEAGSISYPSTVCSCQMSKNCTNLADGGTISVLMHITLFLP